MPLDKLGESRLNLSFLFAFVLVDHIDARRQLSIFAGLNVRVLHWGMATHRSSLMRILSPGRLLSQRAKDAILGLLIPSVLTVVA